MRHVMPSSMVAHVWAQREQDSARTASHNMYFEGDTIYSYGRHFPIARWITNKAGQRAVLFTTRDYSVTTSGHKSDVRVALHGLHVPIFYVENPEASPRELKAGFEKAIADSMACARAARGLALQHYEVAREIARKANELFKFMGQRFRVKVPSVAESTLEKWVEAAARHEQQQRERERKRVARWAEARERHAAQTVLDKEQAQEREAAWLRGENVQYPNWPYYGESRDTLLRVYGDQVQTSRGASIPVEHAKRVWPLILRCKQNGTTYERGDSDTVARLIGWGGGEPLDEVSLRVGHFTIDSIDADGTLGAGCHTIKFDQIEKIARELGLMNDTEAA